MWSRRSNGVTKLKMASTLKERLTTLLVQNNLLTPDKLEKALKIQKEKKERIGDILVELGYISRDNLLEVLSTELNIPAIHLSRYKISPETLTLVSKKIAEHYCLIPVSSLEGTITLAMSDPMNVNALDEIHRTTGLGVRAVLASDKDIKEAIEHYYGENTTQSFEKVMKDMAGEGSVELQDVSAVSSGEGTAQELLRLTEDAPIVKFTNSVLAE